MAAPSRPNALAMLPVTPTEAAASAMMVMVVSFFLLLVFRRAHALARSRRERDFSDALRPRGRVDHHDRLQRDRHRGYKADQYRQM